jgi:hypothetical protein
MAFIRHLSVSSSLQHSIYGSPALPRGPHTGGERRIMSTAEIQSVQVEGTLADIAAAAAAIQANGGTLVSVKAAPAATEGTYSAQIDYTAG